MKHYVLAFIFDQERKNVLLIQKNKPRWQAGKWNGVGGKIKGGERAYEAVYREIQEETGHFPDEPVRHTITFVCPGGTVFVYAVICDGKIPFRQIEKEPLKIWPVNNLPETIMNNLQWLIHVSLSTIQFPLIVQQNSLGIA